MFDQTRRRMAALRHAYVSRRSVQATLASLLLIIIAAAGLWVVGAPNAGAQSNSPFYTLRVYGRSYFGAGADNVVDPGAGLTAAVFDPVTGAVPEDAPYTDLLGVFHPQHPQAPRKDHVTWNPAYMAEGFTFDENQRRGLYNQLFANGINIAEKVWHRHWYEPEHWDKDLNADGRLTRDEDTGRPLDPRNANGQAVWFDDIWYPAIMQEFTYMLMENQQPIPRGPGKPEPLFGRAGQTTFVFPVGMRGSDLFGPDGAIDGDNGVNDSEGFGLTSLDANFDTIPDIVHVDSEMTLFEKTGIAADFNGDGRLQGLRFGSSPTPDGTELAVMHVNLSANPLRVGQYAQFLDHAIRVAGIFNESVVLEIWYTGDIRPRYIGQELLYIGDMALSGTNGPAQVIRSVRNGGSGTNMCAQPVGPWFAFVETVDTVEGTASIWLGRGLGRPFTAMEDGPGIPDRRGGDPWFLKRFYVDGHEYNVVALAARGNGAPVIGPDCDLRDGSPTPQGDPSDFSFITLRTPTPKGPDILIAQHSVRLKGYDFNERLAMLPPFNQEHYIFTDVLTSSGLTPSDDLSPIGYIGPLVGPVPPILQRNGPFPYTAPGGAVYGDARETSFTYRRETTYPEFLGALRQKYGENPAGGTPPFEFFFTEQFWTIPWAFTEFALPDIAPGRTGTRVDPISGRPIANPDLYLLTSAFQSDHAQYQLWVQDQETPFRWGDWSSSVTPPPVPLQERVKFWFDPASSGQPNGNPSGKVYKDGDSLRIYGKGFTSNDDFTGTAGDINVVTDPISGYRVEVPPYTDPWAPFNPQLPQAPRKDSVTFNPAYMDEFRNNNEPLAPLYGRIAVEDADAREKVYHRMWYENSYLDKLRFTADRDQDYRFTALMQEFTYLLVDTQDRPTHGQPGNTRFIFPMATEAGQLPLPPRTAGVGWAPAPSFGYGLTSFDANFDGQPDIVSIDSERTLLTKTGIQVDFNGNGGAPDNLRPTGLPLDGLVVFSVENVVLRRGQSVQFLDHLVTLENIGVGGYGSPPSVDLDFWFTGGGLHPLPNGQYSSYPDFIRTASFNVGDMAVAQRNSVRRIPAGGNNVGRTDGAWFAYVKAVNQFDESVVLTVGRALGATHAAIDNGQGGHNMAPGTPWYLKRFFVDGHEYNVVAVHTVPSDTATAQAEPFEFKYITIRTPVPKPNSFVNYQDSIVLQGYFRGPVLDNPDTNVISVMPPFNMAHTIAEDIVRLTPSQFATDAEHPQSDCVGPPRGAPALTVRVTGESGEPRFLGEIRELLYIANLPNGANRDVWSTEQYHTRPDRYTDVRLPGDQNYLLTSSWTSTQSRLHFFACGDINPLSGGIQNTQADIANAWSGTNGGQLPRGIPLPNTNGVGPADLPVGVDAKRIDFFNAEGPALAGNAGQVRVKLVYNPRDPDDIYVNPGDPSPNDPTRTPTATATRTQTPTRTPTPTGVIPVTSTPTATGSIPVTRTPTATATATGQVPPPPNKPTGLVCSSVSPTQINLQWTNNGAYGNLELFRVPAFPGGSSILLNGGATSYADTGLTPNTTYRYQLRGLMGGAPTDFSNATECTTPNDLTPPPTTPPPTQLACIAVSPTQINLMWTNGAVYNNLELFRSPAFPGGSSLQMAGGMTMYVDGNLSPGQVYRYQIRGLTGGGVTPFSNVTECRTPDGPIVTTTPTATATGQVPPPPNKPTGLVCSSVSPTQINLQWTNNGAYGNLELFRVPAFPGGSSILLNGGATSYADTGLTPNTTYRYQLRGLMGGAPTDFSNATECRTPTDPTPPPPPTPPPSQLACVVVGATQINLQWTNGAAYTNVELFRAPAFPGGASASLPGSATSYADGGLLPSTVYRYQVRGWVNGAATDLSNVTECTVPSVVTSTPTPTATLTGQPPATRTPTPTATLTGQPPTTLTPTPTATATSTGQPMVTRTPTATATATGQVPPNPKPTNLVCAAVSPTQINLQWLNNAVYTNIELFRTPAFPGGSSILLPGSSTIYYNAGLIAGQTYRYQVRGIIGGQPTEWSNTVECLPPVDPPDPPQISCHVISYSIIDVHFNVSDPTVTSLRLERSRNDVNWTEVAITPSTQTVFRNIGLSGGTYYFFRARAYRSTDGLLSEYTTSVSCHTPPAPNRDDVTGTVHMQGRTNNSGARVLIDGGSEGSDITDDKGYFSIAGTTYGEHIVEITMDGYLPISRTINVVSIDTPMGDLYMIAGDTNRDNIVNLFDLTIVGSAFDSEEGQPSWDERADINGDGVINIFDLVLVSNNFDKVGPTDGSPTAGHVQAKTDSSPAKAQMVNVPAAKAQLVTSPQKSAHTMGDLVTVAVEMNGLTDFMGAELNLSFNPAAVQVVDTDTARAGIQVRPGSLFPDGESMIVQPESQVDNTTGRIRFVATRLGQAGYTGGGTLAFITFRVTGCAPLSLSLDGDTLKLANAAGELPYEVFDGQADIRTNCLFLPLLKTGE